MKFRVGHGIDIHRFADGDHVILGGVKIPHTHSIDAHSDGDVVLHAITDALLGALGMGDLGQWFPDSDPELKDIDSKSLLMPIIMSMRDHGYELNNLDVTVVAQAPRLSEYKEAMKEGIAELFAVEDSLINIKATTPEKLGALGRKEGIEAHAMLSLIGGESKTEHTGNHFVLMPEEIDTGKTDVHEIMITDEIELDGDDL